MAESLTMSAVFERMKSRLTGYGFSVHKKHNDVSATLDDEEISFKIGNANPRRFQVEVEVSHTDLLNERVRKLMTDRGMGRWNSKVTIDERFRKSDNGVEDAITWLAGLLHSHKVLRDAINPPPLPQASGFRDGMFHVVEGRHGSVRDGFLYSVTVLGVKSINERNVLIDADRPGADAWFLISGLSQSIHNFITDGERWYPIKEGQGQNGSELRVTVKRSAVESLVHMNQQDKLLIGHALQLYSQKIGKQIGVFDEEA